mmetsp:Transcript_70252/g.164527  ORF Transcript_70252/g.164527 Transcript_70252/m.164527 type:complete len:116 (+) Transcript_70252:42-389(+)
MSRVRARCLHGVSRILAKARHQQRAPQESSTPTVPIKETYRINQAAWSLKDLLRSLVCKRPAVQKGSVSGWWSWKFGARTLNQVHLYCCDAKPGQSMHEAVVCSAAIQDAMDARV